MIATILTSILAQDDGGGGGSIFSLLIIIIPMGAILYMTIIPQRKQRQRQADMLRQIGVGDEVLTTGGLVGVITFVEDELYHLEVDNDVVVRVAQSAIARNLAAPDPADKSAAKPRGLLSGLSAREPASSASTDADSTDAVQPKRAPKARGLLGAREADVDVSGGADAERAADAKKKR